MKFSSFALAGMALAASSVNAFSTPKFQMQHPATALMMSTAVDADTKTALATAANEAR
eukprot:CAMPEP_0113491986 /NCGR_PEP_ID=MMETSP0014_2-20120614/27839_1 /TAXON_ID=2857 /ORGANISM="Nitzschia sp." /LENGTH=57 /DNA_ID=CAMNT_0000385795 /DNA_START=91 /DNA_END=260 /DNA_ORIENTATION=- /assembly_acc=CAM_ASM_000159